MNKKEIIFAVLNGLVMIALTLISGAEIVFGGYFYPVPAIGFVALIIGFVAPIILLVAEYIYFNSKKKQKSLAFYGISTAIWILFLALITITSSTMVDVG